MPERRLSTTQDLRRYLAGLINRTEAEQFEHKTFAQPPDFPAYTQ